MNNSNKLNPFLTIKNDLPSGLVVFLVALPLCLGIALASGAPLFSGLLAGITGGLIVSMISGSQLSVSGPAAGLTVIVASAILTLGSYELFLVSVVLAGVLQLILGYLKAGTIGNYFPSSVIKGMLTAIGLILILKQIPHAIGYDADFEGDFAFMQTDDENTFSEIINAIGKSSLGAIIISLTALFILIGWNYIPSKKIKSIPAPLIVVVLSVIINYLFEVSGSGLAISGGHLVNIPVLSHPSEFLSLFTFPAFSQIMNPDVFIVAVTIAIVASLESLLSVEAIDKLDPLKRNTPTNRELKAQGVGNIVSGLIGGLPVTAVIVRGSTNTYAGAKTKFSSFYHGLFLLFSILLIPGIINKIPLSALAAILIMVGYKLTSISLYKSMYKAGWDQFIPFIITVIAIVFTDLLVGIGIGLAVGVLFILRRNMKNPYYFNKEEFNPNEPVKIILSDEVSFLNKASIQLTLDHLPENSNVIIDGSRSTYIDYDVLEIIRNFKETAHAKNINVQFIDIKKSYQLPQNTNARVVQQTYDKLLENNREWVESKLYKDPDYFKNLSEGQWPKFLFIGCSDSRVPSNHITGTGPGDMFVHRNIANLALPEDKNLMAVLHYAVEVLKVEHIIVCGHYGCGGVKAAMEGNNNGYVGEWISHIKKTYLENQAELENIKDEELAYQRLVELNVLKQAKNLFETSQVQQAIRIKQPLSIHGWVYDMHKGLIKDLNVNHINASDVSILNQSNS